VSFNTLLLSSLPFHDPERLASFHPNEFIPPHDSSKQFHDWREQSAYLDNAALVEEGDVNIGVGHEIGPRTFVVATMKSPRAALCRED